MKGKGNRPSLHWAETWKATANNVLEWIAALRDECIRLPLLTAETYNNATAPQRGKSSIPPQFHSKLFPQGSLCPPNASFLPRWCVVVPMETCLSSQVSLRGLTRLCLRDYVHCVLSCALLFQPVLQFPRAALAGLGGFVCTWPWGTRPFCMEVLLLKLDKKILKKVRDK